ncbi:hypothetical protein SNEBB_006756 [Seison nebaliae]|nr:hypothetical protein SNEBB_006756 [Seison nebaliae]
MEHNVDENVHTPNISFYQLFSFSRSFDRFLIFVAIVTSVISGCSYPLLVLVLGNVTSTFVHHERLRQFNETKHLTDSHQFFFTVQRQCQFIIILGIGTFLCAYLGNICWTISAESQKCRMKFFFLKTLLSQQISWFDNGMAHNTISLINSRIDDILKCIDKNLGFLIHSIIQFIASILIALIISWKLTLSIIALAPVIFGMMYCLSRMLNKVTSRIISNESELANEIREIIDCINLVITFNGEDKHLQELTPKITNAFFWGKKRAILTGLSSGIVFFSIFSCYAFGFWYGSRLIINHEIFIGQIIIIFFCLITSIMGIGKALSFFPIIINGKISAKFIFNFIHSLNSFDNSISISEEDFEELIFDNVSFSYQDKLILKNFSLTIKRGERIGIIGRTGCGKSTIINLLLKFYPLVDGTIKLNGIDIEKISKKTLRTIFSTVFQNTSLFSTTIAGNISMKTSEIDEVESNRMIKIIKTAKMANAHQFIHELSHQYDTDVGHYGASLSGGERQRISIARAIYRKSPCLLLDEATSNLDMKSERLIIENLTKYFVGNETSSIIISHRAALLKLCSRIILMKDGEIVDEGTYEELVVKKQISLKDFNDEKDVRDKSISKNKRITLQSIDETETVPSIYDENHDDESKLLDSSSKKDDAEKKGFYKEIILSYYCQPVVLLILGILLTIFNGLAQPIFAVFFTYAIVVYGEHESLEEVKNRQSLWIVFIFMLGVVQFLTNLFQFSTLSVQYEKFIKRLRLLFVQKLFRKDYSFFDIFGRGSLNTLFTSVRNDTNILSTEQLSGYITAIVSGIVGLGIAMISGWKLTSIILLILPFFVLISTIESNISRRMMETDKEFEENQMNFLLETIQMIRTIYADNLEESISDKYEKIIQLSQKNIIRHTYLLSITFAFTYILIYSIQLTIFLYGAHLVKEHQMLMKNVYLILNCVMFGCMSLNNLSSLIASLSKFQSFAQRFHDYLKFPSSINDRRISSQLEIKEGNIQFSNVTFGYDHQEPILRCLNFRVEHGETIAIVGENGSGKSTILRLLQRLYDVDSGRIFIDGYNIQQFDISEIHSKISCVDQSNQLFGRSIIYNIEYGNNRHLQLGQERVMEVSRLANIHDDIELMSDKYETNVGNISAKISGGQRQRISIARAIISQPTILLLDEATSALDDESQCLFRRSLINLKERYRCTIIIVAHRLATIRDADKIFYLDNGRIVESGTHTELLKSEGHYAKLYYKHRSN